VDAVLLTGEWRIPSGVKLLREHLDWIAPVTVYPGEDELQALAEGVFRVLDGRSRQRAADARPAGRSGTLREARRPALEPVSILLFAGLAYAASVRAGRLGGAQRLVG